MTEQYEQEIHNLLDNLGIPQASEYNSFPLLDRVRTLGLFYTIERENADKLLVAATIAIEHIKDQDKNINEAFAEIRNLEHQNQLLTNEVEQLYRNQY